jgi:hypothetical protein
VRKIWTKRKELISDMAAVMASIMACEDSMRLRKNGKEPIPLLKEVHRLPEIGKKVLDSNKHYAMLLASLLCT